MRLGDPLPVIFRCHGVCSREGRDWTNVYGRMLNVL
jgi:hypothetical protein